MGVGVAERQDPRRAWSREVKRPAWRCRPRTIRRSDEGGRGVPEEGQER